MNGLRSVTKSVVASAASETGLTEAGTRIQLGLLRRHIRVVNYHSTPVSYRRRFEAQVGWLSRRYSNVTYADLVRFLESGKWEKSKPGLIFSFDDGYASHLQCAAPVLNRYGFTGWFFVPSAFLDCAMEDQEAALQQGGIDPSLAAHEGPRVFMTRDEVRTLADQHVVGSHTADHVRLVAGLADAAIARQVSGSRDRLSEILQKNVDTFCWVGGETTSYSSPGAAAVKAAGYRFSFMTCSYPIFRSSHPRRLHRTNLEVSFPPDRLRLQMSGLVDLRYLAKRRHVERIARQGEIA